MAQLVAYIGAGYALGRLGVLRGAAQRVLSRLVVSVFIPLMVFKSIYDSLEPGLLPQSLLFIVCFVIGVLITLALSCPAGARMGLTRPQMGSLVFSCCFTNVGFLMLPLVRTLFSGQGPVPDDGHALMYASMAVMLVNLFMGGFGARLIGAFTGYGAGGQGSASGRRVRISPVAASFALGMLLALTGLKLPGGAEWLLDGAAALTAPIGMAFLGSTLAGSPVKAVFTERNLYILAALHQLAAPLLASILVRLITGDATMALVVGIVVGTPVASAMTAYAMQAGGDVGWSSNYIFLSTLLSALTLPVVVALLMAA